MTNAQKEAALQEAEQKAQAAKEELKKQLIAYMKDNFGTPGYETSWYKHIKGYTLSGNQVYVQTDLFQDAEGKSIGNTIAGAILSQSLVPVNGVLVQDKDSMSLITKIK